MFVLLGYFLLLVFAIKTVFPIYFFILILVFVSIKKGIEKLSEHISKIVQFKKEYDGGEI